MAKRTDILRGRGEKMREADPDFVEAIEDVEQKLGNVEEATGVVRDKQVYRISPSATGLQTGHAGALVNGEIVALSSSGTWQGDYLFGVVETVGAGSAKLLQSGVHRVRLNVEVLPSMLGKRVFAASEGRTCQVGWPNPDDYTEHILELGAIVAVPSAGNIVEILVHPTIHRRARG